MTDEAQAKRTVDAAVEHFGQIDVVVNNAGQGLLGAVEEASDQAVRAAFDVNVFGALNIQRAVLRNQRSGHIVNTSSVAGVVGIPAGVSTTRPSSPWRASARPCPLSSPHPVDRSGDIWPSSRSPSQPSAAAQRGIVQQILGGRAPKVLRPTAGPREQVYTAYGGLTADSIRKPCTEAGQPAVSRNRSADGRSRLPVRAGAHGPGPARAGGSL